MPPLRCGRSDPTPLCRTQLSKGLGDADRRPYRPGKRNYVPLMIVGKICNFEAYASSIMGNSTQRSEHIKDATDLFTAVASGTLPAVSFVKPDGLIDGSSATSKLDLFEGMLQKILDSLAANPGLDTKTAVFITFDEGGGYYDSGSSSRSTSSATGRASR